MGLPQLIYWRIHALLLILKPNTTKASSTKRSSFVLGTSFHIVTRIHFILALLWPTLQIYTLNGSRFLEHFVPCLHLKSLSRIHLISTMDVERAMQQATRAAKREEVSKAGQQKASREEANATETTEHPGYTEQSFTLYTTWSAFPLTQPSDIKLWQIPSRPSREEDVRFFRSIRQAHQSHAGAREAARRRGGWWRMKRGDLGNLCRDTNAKLKTAKEELAVAEKDLLNAKAADQVEEIEAMGRDLELGSKMPIVHHWVFKKFVEGQEIDAMEQPGAEEGMINAKHRWGIPSFAEGSERGIAHAK